MSDVRPSVRLLTVLFSSISSFITWPTKLKLCRVILDIGAHSRSVPDFAILLPGGSTFRNIHIDSQPTSSYPIELKLGRMILDISSHNWSKPNFSISLWGRASRNLQIDSQPTVLSH